MGAAVRLRVGTLLVVGEGISVAVAGGGDTAGVIADSVPQAAATVASSTSRLIDSRMRECVQTNRR